MTSSGAPTNAWTRWWRAATRRVTAQRGLTSARSRSSASTARRDRTRSASSLKSSCRWASSGVCVCVCVCARDNDNDGAFCASADARAATTSAAARVRCAGERRRVRPPTGSRAVYMERIGLMDQARRAARRARRRAPVLTIAAEEPPQVRHGRRLHAPPFLPGTPPPPPSHLFRWSQPMPPMSRITMCLRCAAAARPGRACQVPTTRPADARDSCSASSTRRA